MVDRRESSLKVCTVCDEGEGGMRRSGDRRRDERRSVGGREGCVRD
jgi:hypothetical protein